MVLLEAFTRICAVGVLQVLTAAFEDGTGTPLLPFRCGLEGVRSGREHGSSYRG